NNSNDTVLATANTITHVGNTGISATNNTSELQILKNHVFSNTPGFDLGISLANVNGGAVFVGTVGNGNDVHDFGTGIALSNSAGLVAGNSLSNNIFGVSFAASEGTIDQNLIDNSVFGMSISTSSGEVLITDNTLTDIGAFGISVLTNHEHLQATGNHITA